MLVSTIARQPFAVMGMFKQGLKRVMMAIRTTTTTVATIAQSPTSASTLASTIGVCRPIPINNTRAVRALRMTAESATTPRFATAIWLVEFLASIRATTMRSGARNSAFQATFLARSATGIATHRAGACVGAAVTMRPIRIGVIGETVTGATRV